MHEITSESIESIDFDLVSRTEGFDRIAAEYPGHLTDESKLTMGPFDFLFFPKNEKELSAVIEEMTARKITVTVAGARTGLVGGCVPPSGAMISLEKMHRVLEVYHAPKAGEWRVRAEPGVLLSDLNRMAMNKSFPDLEKSSDSRIIEQLDQYKADPNKYFYPPDPTEMNCSLGGTVATNASGARTFRYGPTRDWVRGLRIMTMTGEVLDIPRGKYFSSPSGWFTIYDSAGNYYPVRVPDYHPPRTKNTSGFYASPHMDLVDLFIGSEGAFGIVTSVDVGLLPWEPTCSIVQFTDTNQRALALVQSLRADRRLKLDFLEFYSGTALKLLRDLQADDPKVVGMPPIPSDAGAAVFFEIAFDPEDPAPDYRALFETISAGGASLENSWAGYEARELARLRVFRHLLPERVTEVIAERKKIYPNLHRLSSDLAVPDEHLLDIWNVYQGLLEEAGIDYAGYGHAGNNHFHISSMPMDMDQLARGMEIYRQFAEKAVSFGGSVSAEHGVGKIKAKLLKLMYSPEQLAQMFEVKKALDPGLMLNPGNIFVD